MLKLCLHRALRPAVQKLPSGLRQAPPAAAGVTAARLPGIGRHTPSCLMGTHGRNEPGEPLNSPKRAKEFIYRLHPNERACLLKELQSFESIAIAQETLETSPPTAAQIRYILLHNAIPFVGFGFLDNAIMIAAGTQIELSIGVTLGISTMAGCSSSKLIEVAQTSVSAATSSSSSWRILRSSQTRWDVHVVFPHLDFSQKTSKRRQVSFWMSELLKQLVKMTLCSI
ncbi:transmembrane protein 65 isoform X3 [Thunnus maccoyii]|uniref:transmembrane protein 65 isoform X3 n=1 Tax=Thunnus maccoyii TaxID=8240 RepID=UPI001C4B6C4B|nr:transmembrane protein 65 isoform X3 [Thunnus maccoyii]